MRLQSQNCPDGIGKFCMWSLNSALNYKFMWLMTIYPKQRKLEPETSSKRETFTEITVQAQVFLPKQHGCSEQWEAVCLIWGWSLLLEVVGDCVWLCGLKPFALSLSLHNYKVTLFKTEMCLLQLTCTKKNTKPIYHQIITWLCVNKILLLSRAWVGVSHFCRLCGAGGIYHESNWHFHGGSISNQISILYRAFPPSDIPY